MNEDKIRDRMQKLLALARRGEGGEKENAQRFLDRMLAKHGMTLADLDDEAESKQRVEFKYKGDLEHRLLVQIICAVLQANEFRCGKIRSGLVVEITRAQRLEIEMSFATYRDELAKNIDRMFLAFISKNRIAPDTDDDDDDKPSRLTREDIAAIRAMMEGMQRTNVRRAIKHDAN